MNLQKFFSGLLGCVLLAAAALAAPPKIAVYKTKTCGCCSKWVDHMKASGFDVTVTDVPSTAEYRKKFGVPEKLLSCHTSMVNGHALEGHVPAADVKRLLKSGAKGKGLAVPGMPLGSPGMEQGPRSQAYSVVLFGADGSTSEFQKYEAK